MNKLFFLLLTLCLASCDNPSKPTLQLFIWSDYIAPEVIERFEKEHNCIISIDTYDSNESMYAKLKLGGSSYDLIFPTQYFLDILRNQKMIRILDEEQLPHLKNIDPDYLKLVDSEDLKFAVPYSLSATGIAYRKDKPMDFVPSWSQFGRTDLKGRMTMLNDAREVIGAALQVLGFSMNSTNPQEIDQAVALVLQWKQNLAKFEGEQYKNGIASREYLISQAYNGDTLQVMMENPEVGFAYAREGTSVALDFAVIPSNAPNVKLAYTFLNYLLTPAIAAENMTFTNFLNPNKAAYPLLPSELRNSPALFLPPEVLKKAEMVRDLGSDNQLYNEAWDKIKSGW